jgi:hypothetical protein
MADIDAVLDSIRSLGDLDRAIAVVRASGATGEVRLASTPIGFIWAPTREEWEAAAYENQSRHRPPETPVFDPGPVAPWSEEEHLRPPFPDLPEDRLLANERSRRSKVKRG